MYKNTRGIQFSGKKVGYYERVREYQWPQKSLIQKATE